MDAPFDALTIGRCGVDLYPLEIGVHLEDVQKFGKFLGGSPTNVAAAVSRLGHRVGVITAVGDDPFGRFVRAEVARLGVDPRFVATISGRLTPITFCQIFPPDNFPLWFYRHGGAPDLQIGPEDLDREAVARARLLWLSLTGFSDEPSRAAHHVALDTRAAAAAASMTVLDLDYRPSFWENEAAASTQVNAALPHVTVAVGNAEECRVAVGESDPDRAADALLRAGVRLAVVKLGPDGALAKTRRERVWVPATKVDVLNGLGAGDGFGGALCHGLLNGWPLPYTLAYASAAGAFVTTRLECSEAMPTARQIEALLPPGLGCPPA